MALRLRGSTSGFVEIDAPAVAGDVTLTLPSTAGTVNVKDTSGNTEVGTGVTLGNPSADIFTISNIGGERLRIASDGTVTIPGVVNIDSAVTIGSSLNVAGVLTYEDVTSVDAIGLSTFRDGLNTKDVGMIDIDTSISDTAVDVFIYDTSKDSDGGAWRKRTTNTSWYNEPLNTATRGSRKEFPSVAVIVAETDQVTIYDGDDPDLPMWMVFDRSSGNSWYSLGYGADVTVTSVTAKNGIISVGKNAATAPATRAGLSALRFIDDKVHIYVTAGQGLFGNITSRNTARTTALTDIGLGAIVNGVTNDVAMTVLPNAPIDDTTGLPVPTIAVATDGGVSIIKDDETIVDIINSNSGYRKNLQVKFTTDNKVVYTESSTTSQYGWMYIHEIPSSDETITINTKDTALGWYDTRTQPYMQDTLGVTIDASINVDRNVGLNVGVGTIIPNIITGNNHIFVAPAENSGITIIEENRSSTNSGLVAYATTSYNTGWMHGDIKGVFLSGISTADITGVELINNGTFDTTSDWTLEDGTVTISAGTLNFTGSGDDIDAFQEIDTEIGKTYTASFEVTSYTAGEARLYARDGGAGDFLPGYGFINSTGTVQHTFVAIGVTSRLYAYAASGPSTFSIDNFTTRLADPDRSVNDKGLQVFGTITKEPVVGTGATAAELVGYSGWSGSNYLYQPYNSDLDFTDEMSIILWVKGWESTDNLLHRGPSTTRNSETSFLLYCDTGYDYRFTLSSDGSTEQNFEISLDNNAVGWQHLCFTLSGGTVRGFLNGEEKVLTNNVFTGGNIFSQATVKNGLYIGINGPVGSSSPVNAYLSLLRLSATAPSAEQIKKIYEDEKVLFQESSKCTLYGSSDAVTALAYDEVTEQLHVGTSSGRSDFLGLRRINNTTVGITTAISAHDTFIVEQ